jgi:HK97 family phage prohead protease
MSTASETRLAAVLNAEPGTSHHAQVAELAQQRVANGGTPADVETKQVAAVAAEPDKVTGTFEAIVATTHADRQGERFAPGAFRDAIDTIRRSGKALPVLFSHQVGDALSCLGLVPPDGWKLDPDGTLHARGWVDVAEPVGARIFRMLRENALQWSVGFRKPTKRPGPDGVRIIENVGELNEISVTALPANPHTATRSAKAAAPSLQELKALERRALSVTLGAVTGKAAHDPLRSRIYATVLDMLSTNRKDDDAPATKTAPAHPADASGPPASPRHTGPVTVTTFDA